MVVGGACGRNGLWGLSGRRLHPACLCVQAGACVNHSRPASSPAEPAQATPWPAGQRAEAFLPYSVTWPRAAAGVSWAAERRCLGPAWPGTSRPVRVSRGPCSSVPSPRLVVCGGGGRACEGLQRGRTVGRGGRGAREARAATDAHEIGTGVCFPQELSPGAETGERPCGCPLSWPPGIRAGQVAASGSCSPNATREGGAREHILCGEGSASACAAGILAGVDLFVFISSLKITWISNIKLYHRSRY